MREMRWPWWYLVGKDMGEKTSMVPPWLARRTVTVDTSETGKGLERTAVLLLIMTQKYWKMVPGLARMVLAISRGGGLQGRRNPGEIGQVRPEGESK
jgi:hypothetical protein